MAKHPLYDTWYSMKKRCFNEKYIHFHRYGGRGITVCDRWMKLENFIEDMGERPEGTTLERINNDGNYEPSNCKWASRKDQANNRSWKPISKPTKRNKTGFIGVCFDKARNNFMAYFRYNGKTINVGRYLDAMEAALDREAAYFHLHKKHSTNWDSLKACS